MEEVVETALVKVSKVGQLGGGRAQSETKENYKNEEEEKKELE